MAALPLPGQTTARTLVTMALRDSGLLALGQSAQQAILNETFIRLNWILATWNTKRWMTWHLIDVAAQSQGQKFFTVGPTGDFDPLREFNSDFNNDFTNGQISGQGRPLKIEKAFARLNATGDIPTDYSLRLVPSYEDYSKIVLKTMSNFPTHFFYDPAVPLGKVYFWPIPQPYIYEMHVLVRQPLLSFATLDSPVWLPKEYEPALELTLAVWLRMAAKMPPDPSLTALCRDAVNTIRVNNTELQELEMPAALSRRSGVYNILADEWH